MHVDHQRSVIDTVAPMRSARSLDHLCPARAAFRSMTHNSVMAASHARKSGQRGSGIGRVAVSARAFAAPDNARVARAFSALASARVEVRPA